MNNGRIAHVIYSYFRQYSCLFLSGNYLVNNEQRIKKLSSNN